MTRIQTACYCLLASAFVLTGVLIVRVDSTSDANTAQADQVIAQPLFSMMTAKTRGDEESLFVLDNRQGALVVYKPNIGREQLEVVTVLSMDDIFGNRGGGRGDRDR